MNTEQKFAEYVKILTDWSGRMNLVAKSTLNDIRARHIDDSIQLGDHLPRDAVIFDLGSGAGFPAVVLAILGYEVVAIESITKKTAFLNELKNKLDLPNLTVINDRIENYLKKPAFLQKNIKKTGVFTARAFAGLGLILNLIKNTGNRAVLLKGNSVSQEIADAKQDFNFDYELTPSKTGDGFIVTIRNIHQKH